MKTLSLLIPALFFIISSYAQNWEQLNDTPFSKMGGVTFVHDGKGYLLGGAEYFGGSNSLWEYDLNTDQWTELPPGDFDPKWRGLMGDYYQGKVYFGFGYTISLSLTEDLWVLDLSDMSYEYLGAIPRRGTAGGPFKVYQDKIYIGMGFGAFSDEFWTYDIIANTWEQKQDMLGGGDIHESMDFIFGEYYYAFGGHNPDSWFKYHIPSDTWESVNDRTGARHGSAFSSYNGKAYIISGEINAHEPIDEESIFMEYDPIMDTWTNIPSFPEDGFRLSPRSFIIDDKLYLFGGDNHNDNREYSRTMYVFDLTTLDNPTSVNTSPEETRIDIVPNPISDILITQVSQFTIY